jgi:hypothetical protein
MGVPISEVQLSPLYTKPMDRRVGSGGLWFSLYGRKGDPMIEMRGLDYRIVRMLHDGRFIRL